MKKEFFIITLKYMLLIGMFTMAIAKASTAQTFTKKTSSGGGFDTSVGMSTGESIKIDGETFNIFETESGSKYIKCTSPRTGNEYAVWVGTITTYEFEGRKVYQSRSGSFCVYKVSSNSGNPYPVWLDMQE